MKAAIGAVKERPIYLDFFRRDPAASPPPPATEPQAPAGLIVNEAPPESPPAASAEPDKADTEVKKSAMDLFGEDDAASAEDVFALTRDTGGPDPTLTLTDPYC